MNLEKFMTSQEINELNKLREELNNAFTEKQVKRLDLKINLLLNRVENRLKIRLLNVAVLFLCMYSFPLLIGSFY